MNKKGNGVFLLGMIEGIVSTSLAVYFKGQGAKQFFSIMICYAICRFIAEWLGDEE